jgi:hypothetical protein
MATTQPAPIATTETIVISQKHYVPGTNCFKFEFPSAVSFKNARLDIVSASFYHQFFNFRPEYNNTNFSITWVDGTVYNFSPSPGNYNTDQFNAYLAFSQASIGMYWLDANNNKVFPISISTNLVSYSNTLSILFIPDPALATSLGLKRPPDGLLSAAFPAGRKVPTFTFPSGIGRIFGFNNQLSHPPSPTTGDTYFYESDSTPIASQIFSILVSCNLLNTSLTAGNNQILTQIPLGRTTFGGLVQWDSNYQRNLNCQPSTFKSMQLYLWDNNYNSLASQLIDTEFTIIMDITWVQ